MDTFSYITIDVWSVIVEYVGEWKTLFSLRRTCRALFSVVEKALDGKEYLTNPKLLIESNKKRSSFGWNIIENAFIVDFEERPKPFIIPLGMKSVSLVEIEPLYDSEDDLMYVEMDDYVKIPSSLESLTLYDTLVDPTRLFEDSTTALKKLSIKMTSRVNDYRYYDGYDISGWIPTSITKLKLNGTEYGDNILQGLCNLKSLKLYHNTRIEGEFVKESVFSGLETLVFHYSSKVSKKRWHNWVSDEGYLQKDWTWVESLPKSLISLSLENVLISDSVYENSTGQYYGIDFIKLPPCLKNFKISHTAIIYGDGKPPISMLNGIPESLTSLDISQGSDLSVFDSTISELLSRTRNLTKLRLKDCPGITGECLSYLPTTMRYLNLNKSSLNPDGLRCLSPFIPLSDLKVAQTNIDDSSLLGLLTSQKEKPNRIDISECSTLSLGIYKGLFDVGLANRTRFKIGTAYGDVIQGWNFSVTGDKLNEHIKLCLENKLFKDMESICKTIPHIVALGNGTDYKEPIQMINKYFADHKFDMNENSKSLCVLMETLMELKGNSAKAFPRIKMLIETFNIRVNEDHIEQARKNWGKGTELYRYLCSKVPGYLEQKQVTKKEKQ